MNVKITQNFATRRIAVKLFDKGFSIKEILQKVNRSQSWFYKWLERFKEGGYSALVDQKKVPKQPASKYPKKDEALVVRIRKRLEKTSVGLVSAGIIRPCIDDTRRLGQ